MILESDQCASPYDQLSLNGIKRAIKRGKDMGRLKKLLSLLIDGAQLPEKYRDHALHGDWKGYRDAHIEPDWLLIYRVDDDHLWLAWTGSCKNNV